MELLDRYLAAVKNHLPANRQDDIIAELRANLESQLEDKEAELGRPLTADEAAAWIKQLGQPMLVAGRYQPQQYLIGPALFPIYWYVMRLAIGWALAIYFIVSAVQLMIGPVSTEAAIATVLRTPGILFVVAGWVTAAFAAFELLGARGVIKFPADCLNPDWSPAGLPPIQAAAAAAKVRGYAKAVGELVFSFLGLIWLLLLPQHPWLMLGPGAAAVKALPYQLAPVWWTFYWWVIALNIVQLVWRCWDLWSDSWRDERMVEKIVNGVLGLAPLIVLLTAHERLLVLLKDPAHDFAKYSATLASINEWTYRGLALVFAISVVSLVVEIAKSVLRRQRENDRAAR